MLQALTMAALLTGSPAGPVRQRWQTPVFDDALDPSLAAALNPLLAELASSLQAEEPTSEAKSNAGGWQSAPLNTTLHPPLEVRTAPASSTAFSCADSLTHAVPLVYSCYPVAHPPRTWGGTFWTQLAGFTRTAWATRQEHP